ncbi:MAG: hypothetical protein QOF84_1323 [Streptomyces sp.]|jgi:DNA-binding MarR family transcriptional regulator|nr:hypothetical protein [Streptomyces sp.]
MQITPWLDEQEMRAWIAYLDASTLIGDHIDRQLQSDAGMPHAHYSVLTRLSAAPGRSIRMSQLAEQLRITRSRLSHTVAKLEKSGLVERREDPADRRGQSAVLTDEGARVLAAAAPGHVAAVRRAVFDQLSREQVGQLADIGEAIARALSHADGAAGEPADLPWQRR